MTSVGPTYANGNTTFTYNFAPVGGNGKAHDISHVVINTCGAEIVSASPMYTERESTSTRLKWDYNPGTSITITYKGYLVAGTQSGYIKASTDEYPETFAGPSCTAVDGKFSVSKLVNDQDTITGASSTKTLPQGGTAHYFYEVKNEGNVPLTLTATDDKLGVVSFSPNPVPAGATATAALSKFFATRQPGSGDETETNIISVTGTYFGLTFSGDARATVTNTPIQALKLTSMCSDDPDQSRAWRVRNPNTFAVAYTWQLVGTDQSGTGTAPSGDSFFTTTTVAGANTVKLLVEGVQHDVKASGGAQCEPPFVPKLDFTVTKTVSSINDRSTGTGSATLFNSGKAYYFYTVENKGNVPLTITSAVDDQLGNISLSPISVDVDGVAYGMAEKSFTVGKNPYPEQNILTVTATAENAGSKTVVSPVANVQVIGKLLLTSMCSDDPAATRAWRVRNPNSDPVTYTWQLVGTGQTGTVTAPPGDSFFTTTTVAGANTVKLLVEGVQHDVKASSGAQCAPVFVPNPAFAITKQVNSVNSAEGASSATTLRNSGTAYFLFTFENTGNVDLIISSAVDSKLGAISFPDTSVPAGEKLSVTVGKPFTAGEAAYSEVNTFTVTAAPEGGTSITHSTPEVTVHVLGKLQLTSMCSVNPGATREWRVRNPNNVAVQYTWQLVGTGQSGGGTAAANGDITFTTNTVAGANTVRILVDGVEHTVVTSDGTACPTNDPPTNDPPTNDPPTNDPPTNDPPVINIFTPAPSFSVTKRVNTLNSPTTAGSSIALTGGGTAYYFYTVTNTGNVAMTITSAVDDKLGPVVFTPGVVQPGQTATAALTKTFPALPAATTQAVETNILSVTTSYAGTAYGPLTASATVINRPAEVPVSTEVVEVTGTPVTPKGSVTVRVLDGSPRNNGVMLPVANADVTFTGGLTGRTNLFGHVVFTDLEFGTFEAAAEADDNLAPGNLRSGNGSTEITSADPDGFITIVLAWDAPLAEAGSVASAVVEANAAINGRICSPKAPGAEIVAVGPDGKSVSTTIAADGILGVWRQYSLKDLLPGSWTLTLKEGGRTASQTVNVGSGETANAADFSLACTGQGASASHNGSWLYFLAGGLMVGAGLIIRRRQNLTA